MVLLSIIVPVYNSESFLEPLLKSIINQSWKNYELILVDDGSNDQSGTICNEYANIDSRICVIHKENRGQSSARNIGLEIAKGDVIAFADNDDIIHPSMYKNMIDAMIANDADVCACGFLNVPTDQISTLKFEEYPCITSPISKKVLLDHYFEPTWRIPVWNKVYKRDLVMNLRFGDYHLGEDNLFSYEVIKNSKKYIHTDDIYYFQRMHGLNYEYTAVEYMTDLLLAKEKILQDIKIHFPESYRICQTKFIYECVRIFNYYSSTPEYRDKQYQAMKLISHNSKPIINCNIPLAHKLRLFWLIHQKQSSLPNELSF